MCRNLLASEGVELSEPMVFGLGSGLGFSYMEKYDRKTGLREPVVLCTAGPGRIAKNLREALGLGLVLEETVSRKEARANLFRRLDDGKPYGLKLDRFYLDYMERKAHFAAHYLTACGYDESNLYVIDIKSDEIRKSALQNIEQARSAKGFMASKNLGLYYERRSLVPLEKALRYAMSRTVADMLYNPSTFSGVKGVEKFAEHVIRWQRNPNFRYQLLNHYITWEGEGETLGGFRGLFADFLEQASIALNNRELSSVANSFRIVAEAWSEIDGSFKQLCLEQDGLPSRLAIVSKAIKKQARLEAEAYRKMEQAITC
jgi:hypothetical protein